MRNSRSLVMILVSVGLGLAAVLLAWRLVEEKTRVDTNMVVVASRDVDLGARITPDMVQLVQWPKGSMPEGAFQTVDPLLKDPKTQEPRVLRASLQRGEPVLESKLATLGTKGGLSAVIAEGKRAITVRVNDVIGVAGFALPGSYVDVLVSTTADSAAGAQQEKNISKIVLDRILVLAIAQEVSRDETKPKVVNAVTLEVTPEQAEKLDLARSVGTLSLVLRNQVDVRPVTSIGVTKQQLLRRVGEPQELVAAVAPMKPVATKVRKPVVRDVSSRSRVEVIKGTERSSHEF